MRRYKNIEGAILLQDDIFFINNQACRKYSDSTTLTMSKIGVKEVLSLYHRVSWTQTLVILGMHAFPLISCYMPKTSHTSHTKMTEGLGEV